VNLPLNFRPKKKKIAKQKKSDHNKKKSKEPQKLSVIKSYYFSLILKAIELFSLLIYTVVIWKDNPSKKHRENSIPFKIPRNLKNSGIFW